MTNISDFEARLRRLEDRDEIRTLVAAYGKVVDDKDLEGLRAMFAPDVSFGSKGASQKIEGRDTVVAYYETRFMAIHISNHFTHDHVIWFENDDLAHGHVNAHVEVVLDAGPMVSGLRYEDTYSRHEGAWKFRERITSFFYYVKTADYLSKLPESKRNYYAGDPVDADWPEGVATWQAYEKERG